MRKSVQIASLLVAAALLGGVATLTWAVDGVILIDQNKALAGNVTPGDAPGFPISINQPGSYRLASNLVVPNENTTAIEINADHVTLDLNGFAILGPTDCSGGLTPCSRAGAGFGVNTPAVRFNITVRNGTIQGMGAAGINLSGDSHVVEDMHVRSNGIGGIAIFASADFGGSIVRHNTVQRNGGRSLGIDFGIRVTKGVATNNTADVNENGIYVATGTATYNVITRNLNSGLYLAGGNANYIGNVLDGNGGSPVVGGTNQGQNLCNGVVCPGAAF